MIAPLHVAVLVDRRRVNRYLLDLVDWLEASPDIVLVGVFRPQRGYPPPPDPDDIDAQRWREPDGRKSGSRVAAAMTRPRGGWTGMLTARLFFALDRWISGQPSAANVGRGMGRVATQPVPAQGIACDLLIRAGSSEAAAWHAARDSRYGAIGLDFALDADPLCSSAGLDEACRGEHETGFVLYRILSPMPRASEAAPQGQGRQSRVSPWPANVIRHGWYQTRATAADNRTQLYGNVLRQLKDAVRRCADWHRDTALGRIEAMIDEAVSGGDEAVMDVAESPWLDDPQAVHDAGRPVAPMLNGRRLGRPSLLRQLVYGYRLSRRLAGNARARLTGGAASTSLGVASLGGLRNGHPVTMSLTGIRPVSAGRASHYANPFIVAPDAPGADPVVFVESREPKQRGTHIAALAIEAGMSGSGRPDAAMPGRADAASPVNLRPLGPMLQGPQPLSFPFMFRFDGGHYMCPNEAGSNRITVYRANAFPGGWEAAAVLMDGICAANTMLFETDDRWWLLTNLDRSASTRVPATGDQQAELHLFHAASPLSNRWVPHPLNPLRIDSRGARNGGLIIDDDVIYRCGQIPRFGRPSHGLALYRIATLTPDRYREVLVRIVEPEHLANLTPLGGVRGWNQAGDWAVFDLQHRGPLRHQETRIRAGGVRAGGGRRPISLDGAG